MQTLEQLQTGQLAGAVSLKLSCGLTEFPREIFDLADTLEVLDLSGNALSSLPDDLPRLTKLRIIFCSINQFTVLPAVLGECTQLRMIGFKSNRIRHVPETSLPPALRWLILTDNEVAVLPRAIGRCTQLQKLMLAGNQLACLPVELASCTKLELLRIAANRLTALPAWILAMPRLAWLAYAGNPFSAADEAAAMHAAHPAAISWNTLQLKHKLGEGASGVIYQALWQDTEKARAVAVKLFKGAMTSDGLPQCELTACIGAGSHANLIPVLGEVPDHPEAVRACVMDLIDPEFINLAGPPSMESCTRDIYADTKSFTPASVLAIAYGIASAAHHLHSQGIMHGDLYAHNILHTEQGHALLGDFGAASLLASHSSQADQLQRLEVRAFGILLGELLSHRDSAMLTASLAFLESACLHPDPAARPLFDHVARELMDLRSMHQTDGTGG
jgi:hypothetical protein